MLHKHKQKVTGKDSAVNRSYQMICFSVTLIPSTVRQGLLA